MEEASRSEILPATPEGVAEAEVTNQNVYGTIRTLFEQGVSRKAIARQLGLDVKTVRKWLKRSWARQQRCRSRALDPYREFLKARAPEVGFNGSVLKRELEPMGFTGTYATVARYIAPWRKAWTPEPGPTVRFETGPGEQSQVDWGSVRIWLGEQRVKVHLFTMVLGFSRRIFVRAYLNERLDNLLDGHARAFAHFGGRTESILYDNPRTIVTAKDEHTDQVVWNATFKDRMDFYGVTIKLCRYYRAQTKGKIESGVKYVKRNALAGRRFRDLEELNEYLLEWCLSVADQRPHGTTHEKPSERFVRAERLITVDQRVPARREEVAVRRVPRDAYVAVEANRYPVPFTWAGRDVTVRLLAEQVVLHLDGDEAVTHERLAGKHQVARWNGPPRPLPKSLRGEMEHPPRLDPAYVKGLGDVEIRELSRYQEVAR
jgi:transposase